MMNTSPTQQYNLSEGHRHAVEVGLSLLEKNQKAAKNTVMAANAGTADIDSALQLTLECKAIFSAQRQLELTPIERLAQEQGEPAQTRDSDGAIAWGPDVPSPRPQVGQRVHWSKSGHTTGIARIEGYDVEDESFRVIDDAGSSVNVSANGKGEWYARYADDGGPIGGEPRQDRIEAHFDESTPRSGDDDSASGIPDAQPDSLADTSTPASEELASEGVALPDAEQPRSGSKTKPSPQRERNARQAGVAAPKPGAAKKAATKKGGSK